jgi:hypothetical protein
MAANLLPRISIVNSDLHHQAGEKRECSNPTEFGRAEAELKLFRNSEKTSLGAGARITACSSVYAL